MLLSYTEFMKNSKRIQLSLAQGFAECYFYREGRYFGCATTTSSMFECSRRGDRINLYSGGFININKNRTNDIIKILF